MAGKPADGPPDAGSISAPASWGWILRARRGSCRCENFHPIFDLARELSLPFTCHAGDSQGPETVRAALDFGAKRIGHGHHIYDDPTLWPRAIRQGVTLEICPTSNIQCKTQPSYALHPAKRLLDAGLRVTISTDNMTLAAVTLEDEYRHCVTQMGFTGKICGPWPAMRWTQRFCRRQRSARSLENFNIQTNIRIFLDAATSFVVSCYRKEAVMLRPLSGYAGSAAPAVAVARPHAPPRPRRPVRPLRRPDRLRRADPQGRVDAAQRLSL